MKKWAKLFGILCVFVIGLTAGLAGCATVGSITNSSTELIYNGNSAVMVDGYLYFANSAVDSSEITSSTYSSFAATSYLARVNTNEDLGATSADYSPSSVGNVDSEVTGYDGNFMFVLGQSIYYATPNKREGKDADGNYGEYYDYMCLYKADLNGDNQKELYTTTGTVSDIQVLQSNGTYYIVIFAGTKLIKINLSSGKSTTIADDVESVAMPDTYQSNLDGSTSDWNGYIYYTVSKTSEGNSGNTYYHVYKVALSGGSAEDIYSSSDITLSDRVGDTIFFTETKSGSTSAVYFVDVSKTTQSFTSATRFMQTSATISDVRLIATSAKTYGYIYTISNSTGIGYYNKSTGKNGVIKLTAVEEELTSYNILFVSGRTIYLSTTTAIYKVDISDLFSSKDVPPAFGCTEIVAMTAIYDGTLYAFDGTYIYFYAQLEDLEDEEEGLSGDTITDDDANYYLYRTDVGKMGDYQLMSKTSTSLRRS